MMKKIVYDIYSRKVHVSDVTGLRWKEEKKKKEKEKKKGDSANYNIYTKPCIVWNRNRHEYWHSFDLVILQAKHFIYRCKQMQTCLSALSCFLQQLMLKYNTQGYNSKISGELSAFNLNGSVIGLV